MLDKVPHAAPSGRGGTRIGPRSPETFACTSSSSQPKTCINAEPPYITTDICQLLDDTPNNKAMYSWHLLHLCAVLGGYLVPQLYSQARRELFMTWACITLFNIWIEQQLYRIVHCFPRMVVDLMHNARLILTTTSKCFQKKAHNMSEVEHSKFFQAISVIDAGSLG